MILSRSLTGRGLYEFGFSHYFKKQFQKDYDAMQIDHDFARYVMLAAKKGCPEAMLALSHMYEVGQGGVAVNYKKSLEMALKSAEQENERAMCRLVQIYGEGLGEEVPKNEEEFLKWLDKLVGMGNKWAKSIIYFRDKTDKRVEPELAESLERTMQKVDEALKKVEENRTKSGE